MAQTFTCPNGATQNPDGTLTCDQWVLVELPAPDPIHGLTQEQLVNVTESIFMAFAMAYCFRFLTRFINQSGFGRGNH